MGEGGRRDLGISTVQARQRKANYFDQPIEDHAGREEYSGRQRGW